MAISVRVKICGITRWEDALAAAEAGADAVGFMFYQPSARYLSIEAAAAITRRLPPFVARVGVFVNAVEDLVRHAVEQCGLQALQFHGEEPPEFCARFSLPQIKAFRVRDERSLDECRRYPHTAWLLDSYVPGQPGGTGATFNWELAVQASQSNRCILLAGGLTPENVADAVRRVRPYGVDVSSGVESRLGQKDPERVRAFIEAAKQA